MTKQISESDSPKNGPVSPSEKKRVRERMKALKRKKDVENTDNEADKKETSKTKSKFGKSIDDLIDREGGSEKEGDVEKGNKKS